MSSALWLMTGPTSVSSSQPGPSVSFSTADTSRLESSPYHLLVDDDPARSGAALTGGAERRPDDPVDGQVEVGVVEDDDRVLAAELEVDPLEVLRAVLHDGHARVARAGERDHGHIGMAYQPIADGAPTAVHDVDDALGDTGLVQQLDEALPERGRVSRRLEDDGVPRDERRRDLPGRDRDREVPGRDRADDPDRHAHRHVELVAELGRRRLAEQTPALAAHVVAHVDRFLDVAAGLGRDLSHLVSHEVGHLVLALDEELREAEEDLATLRRRDEPPLLVRVLRRGDRAVDVVRAGLREDPDQLAVGRARRLEGLTGCGIQPFAADEVL